MTGRRAAGRPVVVRAERDGRPDRDDHVVAVVGPEGTRGSQDAVVRRAIEEAARRTGELVVVQLLAGSSELRRTVASSALWRDVVWWSRDLDGIVASVRVVPDDEVGEIATAMGRAACVVMAAELVETHRHLLPLARRAVGATTPRHPWPVVAVVPSQHSR
ncbi:hypothetical protein AERO_03660 [Aeromicrobium fastidiosum]|uniref:hypothetical protein n=1 Tax=Aeromicrobium TaxID=2040 RepID=UPI001780C1E0|nr:MULTISPECIES: hypothetical protein [Aeromicrobium]MBD8606390.1 hypothetical protein [Aeromicrobium sp. CFBP 8757]MCL8250470.1 hypothetical protein [Aeromicrobium fastidiosum]